MPIFIIINFIKPLWYATTFSYNALPSKIPADQTCKQTIEDVGRAKLTKIFLFIFVVVVVSTAQGQTTMDRDPGQTAIPPISKIFIDYIIYSLSMLTGETE